MPRIVALADALPFWRGFVAQDGQDEGCAEDRDEPDEPQLHGALLGGEANVFADAPGSEQGQHNRCEQGCGDEEGEIVEGHEKHAPSGLR